MSQIEPPETHNEAQTVHGSHYECDTRGHC